MSPSVESRELEPGLEEGAVVPIKLGPSAQPHNGARRAHRRWRKVAGEPDSGLVKLQVPGS